MTLFPGYFDSPFATSIIARAKKAGLVEFDFVDPRDFATDRHRTVDDYPYGGGCGMVMKPGPVKAALELVKSRCEAAGEAAPVTVYLTPQGEPLRQKTVEELAEKGHVLLFCGHYEDIDYRARRLFDREISVGDYVLSGGEPAAAAVADALVRKIPGALGNPDSAAEDSFSKDEGVFDCPHYTRPPEWEGMRVPEVLLGGDHKKIAEYRRARALINTMRVRPDLLRMEQLSEADFKAVKRYFMEYHDDGDGREEMRK